MKSNLKYGHDPVAANLHHLPNTLAAQFIGLLPNLQRFGTSGEYVILRNHGYLPINKYFLTILVSLLPMATLLVVIIEHCW